MGTGEGRPERAGRSRRLLRFASTSGAVLVSLALTALMSLLLHGRVRPDFMITGVVCAAAVVTAVARVTRRARRALAAANDELEARVAARTAELAAANAGLRAAALTEAALQRELAVRDQLATAGTLAGAVCHEIRNPLTAVVMASDELRAELADGHDPALAARLGQCAADIAEASAQIGLVVRDLSLLTSPGDDGVGPVDVDAALDAAARLASYRLRGRGRVECERGGRPTPPVRGAPHRLVQVFLNLFTNAAQASAPDRCNVIEVTTTVSAGVVVVTIRDRGVGMDAATLARAYEPHFTTRRAEGGSGLGLAICRTLVESAGGALTLSSQVGVGTTVRVELPRAMPTAEPGPPAPTVRSSPRPPG